MELKLSNTEKKMILENRLNKLRVAEESNNLELNIFLDNENNTNICLNDKAIDRAIIMKLTDEQCNKIYNFLVTKYKYTNELKELCINDEKIESKKKEAC